MTFLSKILLKLRLAFMPKKWGPYRLGSDGRYRLESGPKKCALIFGCPEPFPVLVGRPDNAEVVIHANNESFAEATVRFPDGSWCIRYLDQIGPDQCAISAIGRISVLRFQRSATIRIPRYVLLSIGGTVERAA